MSDTVIAVSGLSKSYTISHQRQERYVALRDVVTEGMRNLYRGIRRAGQPGADRRRGTVEEFWALRDVSLQVRRGDRVGIIGRNGAGKTTLLKLISRITEPTRGRIEIEGRVASLLEVGTGFHPELTGRENIFLNGAILGMTRAEIRRKFDEIVAFSEVERFLDTPVKRYSSGMYVRLAFSVAAHLESEILVVDEVLAVGDAQFQKKCLGKMEAAEQEGRTLLFVSHNMATISSLCRTGLLLDGGEVVAAGKMSDVVLEYYAPGTASPAVFDTGPDDGRGRTADARLLSGAVVDDDGQVRSEVDISKPVNIVMRYRVAASAGMQASPNFHFYGADGSCAFVSSPRNLQPHARGLYEAVCHIPGNFLNEGTYFVGLALTSFPGPHVQFFETSALAFNVRDPLVNVPTRGGSDYAGPIPGVVRPLLAWEWRCLE
jgi:lipopolysaccharide transport system ATP-binding protein